MIARSHAAGSLTGIPVYHKAFDLPVPGVLHTSCPHYFRYSKAGESEEAFTDRMVAEVEALIAKEGADTVAAFIAQPIMGAGGVPSLCCHNINPGKATLKWGELTVAN